MDGYCWVCSDYQYDCDFICDAVDEETLMKQIAHHLATEHDQAHLDEETEKQLKELMKKPDK